MPQPPSKIEKPKVEKVTPKSVKLRGGIKETVLGVTDGKMDAQTSEQALQGVFTRTLMVDPPGALIFECVCGHKRRVLHSERTFRCERGGWPKPECDIVWTRKLRFSGDYDEETGRHIMEDDTVDVPMETVNEFTGKKEKVMAPCPQFEGRRLADVRREAFAERRAAGLPESDQPQNQAGFEKGSASE